MKATLTFDLDDSDDKLAHFRCVKALDMALALWEIQNYVQLVSELEQAPCGEAIRERVLEIFDTHGISPYDLSN